MEIIIADSDRMEIGVLTKSKQVDIDIGETNDFQISISRADSKELNLGFGKYIFVPESEFGGIIEELQSTTSSTYIYWSGYTWRGFLDQIIIEPPENEAYLTLNGEANAVIRQLLQPYDLGKMFDISQELSGINIRNYKVPRYWSALSVIVDMLAKYNAKINILAKQGDCNEAFSVLLSAAPIVDYSEELEYSDNDQNVSMTIRDYRRGINHLICLGQGELTEREVLHLYLQFDKTIGKKKYYSGINERAAVYENTSAQSLQDLEDGGRKRLVELQNYKEQELKVTNVDLSIGDIVAGRDYETNSYISKPIINKVLSSDRNGIKIQYKVRGED